MITTKPPIRVDAKEKEGIINRRLAPGPFTARLVERNIIPTR
jgi:hypothetical protein